MKKRKFTKKLLALTSSFIMFVSIVSVTLISPPKKAQALNISCGMWCGIDAVASCPGCSDKLTLILMDMCISSECN